MTTTICDLPLFSGSATPQTQSRGDDIELIRQEVERYLRRMHEAICADVTDLEERIAAIEAQLSGSA